MKTGILLAAAMLAAPALAMPDTASDPDAKTVKKDDNEQADAAKNEDGAEAPVVVEIPEVKADEKRICRRVKLDMSSRRASKVCKTKEEWRLFNQRR